MASMYIRGDTFWAKWYDPPGVKHDKSLGTKDKKEANARFKEIEARLARGRHVVFPGCRPFADILEDFLTDKRARREEWTVKTYEKHAKHLGAHFPVTMRIGSIEAAHVQKYLDARQVEGAGAQTLNHERTTIATIFNWAIKRDYAERNPAMKVESYSVRPEHRRIPTPEEWADVVSDLEAEIAAEATGEHRYVLELLRDVVVTIWWSGLRIGEVARLEVADVDLKREVYSIRSARNKGPRIEPMRPEVKNIFERRSALKRALVFATQSGEGAYHTLKGGWQNFLDRHKKHRDARIGFHALRHAFNTRLGEVIDNPLIAMRATGHKTMQMSSHYTHLQVPKVREALMRLA